MILRENTRQIKIDEQTYIGGSNDVLIQSMCNIKTSKIDEIVKQINECAKIGAKLMRVSVLDKEDALAIKDIVKQISIPLVADIHFDYKLAILAIENGAKKIRINPGNIGSEENVAKIIECAKKYDVAIRIGVNSGSMDKEIYDYNSKLSAELMVKSIEKYIKIFEKYNFHKLILSLKSSDVLETIEAYRLAANKFNYPLHIGITEAGIKEVSTIRSTAGLAPLLYFGIGNTIRISITGDPRDEIIAAKALLSEFGLVNIPKLISCPTCGRTEVNLDDLSNKVHNYLKTINAPITVAIMGCIVNGPGEAKNADIGLAGGKNKYILFKKGQIIATIDEKDAYSKLIKEIENILKNY